MNTISALIIVLCLEQIQSGKHAWLDKFRALRRMPTCSGYVNWVVQRLSHSMMLSHWLGAIILLLPIPLLVGMLQMLFGHTFNMGAFLLNVSVLFLCMRSHDELPILERSTLEYRVERTCWQFVDGQFAVLFWYVLFGPFGAVLFRLSSVLHHGAEASRHFAQGTYYAYYSLAWIPARLTAFFFALVGSFVPCFEYWRHTLSGPVQNEVMVRDCALASVGESHGSSIFVSLSALLHRTQVVWLFTLCMMLATGLTF
ncbi:MAG: hypothetical protein V4490_04640 [Pseudomonadota bacterium]